MTRQPVRFTPDVAQQPPGEAATIRQRDGRAIAHRLGVRHAPVGRHPPDRREHAVGRGGDVLLSAPVGVARATATDRDAGVGPATAAGARFASEVSA